MVNSVYILHSLLFFCFIQLPTLSYSGGFTVDLIHRDSALSPLYNGPKTKPEYLKEAFHYSHSRAVYLSRKLFQTRVIPTGILTEYLVKLSIGTPPVPIYLLVDTGSDLTWTQCSPCESCYKKDYPLFDPKKSSTFKPLPCNTRIYQDSHIGFKSSCPRGDRFCKYHSGYADGSHADGDLAFETFTFGLASVPNLFFGCGQNNSGSFSNASTGTLGLGFGNISIVNQLSGSIKGKFSHCFVDYDPKFNATGTISFGDVAVVSGLGVVSTPLFQTPDHYYQLTLEGVSVGNKRFGFPKNSTSSWQNGNIIIDSGTTLTILPAPLVDNLELELKRVINGKQARDPSWIFNLCYNKTIVDIVVPDLTFEFRGGGLKLPQSRTFVELDDGLVCFGIVRSYDGFYVFGNQLQVDLLVGYDLGKNQLSFKRTDCAKR